MFSRTEKEEREYLTTVKDKLTAAIDQIDMAVSGYARELQDHYPKAVHLSDHSTAFSNGIVITSVHMAKGLEFDHVIVPGADSRNYSSE